MSEAQREAETIVNFNEDEAAASIYTASKRVATLLERRGLKPIMVNRLKVAYRPAGGSTFRKRRS